MKGMKRFLKRFRYGEKGFTLIELLVVVAILGVLAAVAIPNVGKLIGKGETEAQAMELNNVQTAVIALIADSDNGALDTVPTGASGDMDDVSADVGGTATALSSYMSGLGDGNTTEYCYTFTTDGVVTQTTCPSS